MEIKIISDPRERFVSTAHLGDILRLAIPAMAALASQPILSIGDTAMIGRLGVEPLAARAVGAALIGAVYWIFAFLTFGTTTLIGHHYGADDAKACGDTYLNALMLALVGGGITSALGIMLAPRLFELMGAEADVAYQGVPYFRFYIASAPFTFIFLASVGFFRGIQNTKTPMVLAFVTNGLHLLLDYGLIYGRFGLPSMGLFGAAIAAWIAQLFGAAIFLTLFFFSPSTRPYRPSHWQFSPTTMRPLFRIGRELAIRTGALRFSLVFATAIAARMGASVLSAHEIAFQLFLLCSDVIDGLAVAGQALVAKYLGSRRKNLAYDMGKSLIFCGGAAGCLFALAFLGLQEIIIQFFTSSAEVMVILSGGVFILITLFQPLNGIVFVLDGFLIGAHDTRFLMRAMMFGALAIFVPLSWLALQWGWDLMGIWAGVSALMIWRLVTNCYRFLSGNKITLSEIRD